MPSGIPARCSFSSSFAACSPGKRRPKLRRSALHSEAAAWCSSRAGLPGCCSAAAPAAAASAAASVATSASRRRSRALRSSLSTNKA
ncbi:hypothetical protein SD70_26905 [Gordoniibacillus kamchatkensis]|uniref:Uncharacterized protein n=1 Tax=Gordoniibacillus kamchatkensis TaxID=1590651 RepID=A0ABR5ABE4_9BACL|nr:hypothetical protein [Paenibacillus sp. VKM B-2647]KIL38356.1 hypothetical protein SD70_26905 [Paenibacillus sp. VKM B-2647]